MKPLHWKRVLLDPPDEKKKAPAADGAPPAGVWDVVRSEGHDEPPFDVDGFEAAFAAAAQRAGTADGAAAKAAKPTITKSLDTKRSNAIAIMMSSLPPIHELRAAIGALDESILSREQLEKVRANLPTQEEMDNIAGLDGPDVRWDKPEKFLKELMSIPKLRVRLRCWSIKYGFAERAAEIEETIVTLGGAVRALRGSQALPMILGAVLALGNHLNGGTARGRADGFTLEVLGRLGVFKDNSNSLTLLDYVLRQLTSSGTSVPSLPDELAPLREGAKLKLADMRGALQKLAADAKELERAAQLDAGGDGDDVVGASDPFAQTMAQFATRAATEVAGITSRLGSVEQEYKDVLAWLRVKSGGAGAKAPMESDEFFTIWVDFADAVKQATPKAKAPQSAAAAGALSRMSSAASNAGDSKQGGASPLASGGAAPRGTNDEVELDPMMSRLKRLSMGGAAPPPPSAAKVASSDASRASLTDAQVKKASAVDKKLQDRLAARFARAQARGQ